MVIMETILLYKKEDEGKIREILGKDEYRGISPDFKDPKYLECKEEEGTWYWHLDSGQEELVKRLISELGELAREAENKDEILAKLKSQEVPDGAGAMFDL